MKTGLDRPILVIVQHISEDKLCLRIKKIIESDRERPILTLYHKKSDYG